MREWNKSFLKLLLFLYSIPCILRNARPLYIDFCMNGDSTHSTLRLSLIGIPGTVRMDRVAPPESTSFWCWMIPRWPWSWRPIPLTFQDMPNGEVCMPVHEKLAVSPSLILSERGWATNAVITHRMAISVSSGVCLYAVLDYHLTHAPFDKLMF